MKKFYIKPNLAVHKISIEGIILAGSPEPDPVDPEKEYQQEGPYTGPRGIGVKDGDADEIGGR